MPNNKASVKGVMRVQELRHELIAACLMIAQDEPLDDEETLAIIRRLEEIMLKDARRVIGNRNPDKSVLTWEDMRLLMEATLRSALKILE